MKKLIQKVTLIVAIFSTFNLFAQGDYTLDIEQEVQGSDLIMDLFIQRTSGTDFALSSCNFAVFIDTANLDINAMSKVSSADGPWDNGTVPSSYLDLILGKGADFINLSTRRNTSGNTIGYNVTTDRTKIGRISIPIKNSCGTNSSTWNSGPAAQTMMPLTSIKSYATFRKANPNFPLCEMPAQPNLLNVSGVKEVCEGDFINLTTDATSDIQWYKNDVVISGANSISLEVKETGKYTVEAVNCTSCRALAINTESIVINPLPTKPAIEEIGGLLSTTTAGSLQWYKDGNVIEGATETTYTPTTDGEYTVENSNSCGKRTSEMFKLETTGVSDELVSSLSAFPNPYKGSTVITYTLAEGNNVVIELFDAIGKNLATLENTTKGAGEYTLNFSAISQGFSEGIYFVKLTIGGESKTIKLVELR